jgi:RNA polymerase sigma-70 factor (ECF subfamily)
MQDADAIARCLAGDASAYAALVAAHGDVLVGVLRALLGSLEDARDVAQETFVRAYQNLHRYDPACPFRPWLLRIGRNLALNQLIARRRRPEGRLHDRGDEVLEGLADGSVETSSPHLAVVRDEARTAVEAVLAQLRPEYRDVLVLRYMARLEYEEIADALEVPVGTVKTWLHRAKAQFRALGERIEVP